MTEEVGREENVNGYWGCETVGLTTVFGFGQKVRLVSKDCQETRITCLAKQLLQCPVSYAARLGAELYK